MFKNILIKLANKIINKYNVHYLDTNSTINIYNNYFKIYRIDLTCDTSKGNYISIEGNDLYQYSFHNK